MRYICYDCEPPCYLNCVNCDGDNPPKQCPMQGGAHWVELQEPTEEEIQKAKEEEE